jgi:multiple sugar transport system permease protein
MKVATLAGQGTQTTSTTGAKRAGEIGIAWLAVTPATTLLAGLLFGPAAAVVLFSLTDWQLGAGSFHFVGFRNFLTLFGDPIFMKALLNTLLYVAIVVPGTVLLGLAVALMIEASPCLRGFYRAMHFLPVMAATSAMAVVWGTILHPSIGLVNRALAVIGISGPNWLRDEHTALFALAVIGIWQGFGFAMMLFVSGLKAVPQQLYDAAAVDGADDIIDRLRIVTLPMLGPVTLFVVLITASRAFEVFDSVRVLTQGGPNYASEVLLNRLYTESFDYLRTGYGAALTVVYLTIVVLLTLAQARLLERRVHYA